MSKEPVRAHDLLRYRIPDNPQITPDGLTVFYRERYVAGEPAEPRSRLMRARPGESPTAFTSGELIDSQPLLSPDGCQLAFVRREAGGAGGPAAETRLCVIAVGGGEARTLVSRRGSFGQMSWSPDSRQLVVSLRRADELDEGETQPLSIRVTRWPYKADGGGYLPVDRFRLYRVDTAVAEPELQALTEGDGDWDDVEPAWSPDGSRIAFMSNRRPNAHRDPENQDLFVMDAAGGPPIQCTKAAGWAFSPAWSPDASWIALLGCPGPPGYALFRANVELFRVDPTGQADEASLTAGLDRCVMNLTIDDLWGLDHWTQPPVFTPDGRGLLIPVSDRGTTWVGRLTLDDAGRPTGLPERVVDDRIVVCFNAASEADQLVLITTHPREPGQVETCRVDGTERQVLAAPLQDVLSECRLAAPEELWVETPDERRIQGWVLWPEGDGPHPLLLDIHGGPVVQFGNGFFHELQTFAAAGYAVLFVNPRGSQGYGREFAASIHRNWGEGPMIDVMTALDHVLASGRVDPERMGVLGGSYGGYMTTWVIAHTQRFAAACTQRTVSSMEAMIWSDVGALFGFELEAFFWEDAELYKRLSPITYAESIETPLLIMQGLADQRTPVDQGERLYVTLRMLDKPVEMVLFPGGTHDMSRNGRPAQRLERLEVILGWFARHLKPPTSPVKSPPS